jgi:hypothetical protein
MASRSMRASYQQSQPRKGSMTLFGNGSVTWDAFTDGHELMAVTDPYEFPVFYHVGQREDGKWHVLSVEEHDYPLDPWEDQAELERQLARVRGMRLLDVGDKGFREVMDAFYSYVRYESPEAKAKWDEHWKRNQAEAVRILAEAKGARYQKPERPPVERKPSSHRLLGGLFLTFGGDR